jgi:hypothetical protein
MIRSTLLLLLLLLYLYSYYPYLQKILLIIASSLSPPSKSNLDTIYDTSRRSHQAVWMHIIYVYPLKMHLGHARLTTCIRVAHRRPNWVQKQKQPCVIYCEGLKPSCLVGAEFIPPGHSQKGTNRWPVGHQSQRLSEWEPKKKETRFWTELQAWPADGVETISLRFLYLSEAEVQGNRALGRARFPLSLRFKQGIHSLTGGFNLPHGGRRLCRRRAERWLPEARKFTVNPNVTITKKDMNFQAIFYLDPP